MRMGTSANRVYEKARSFRLGKDSSQALIFFLISGFLVSAIFFPNLSDINAWDEAAYVHSGLTLIDGGDWPELAGNPVTALVFGLTYLPFKSSTFWMLYSISLSRIILFALLWLSAYLVSRELTEFASPLVTLGFLFVTPLTIEMLRFPSDPLFASLAALSLWQLLKHRQNFERKHLIYASIFMALAGLARNDGLVLFAILVFLTLIHNLQDGRWKSSIVAVLLPFISIVGGYVLVSGTITGNFNLGVNERTYSNFESGQQRIYVEVEGINPVIEARMESRRLFGTPEENQYSVFRAISRNPQAYLDRLILVSKSLPKVILNAYGIRFSAVIFYFMLRGIAELFRRKQYLLSLTLILWPMHLVSGFVITLFRTGHLQFPYYIVFTLAAIGLSATAANLDKKVERTLVSFVMLGLILYGIVDNKLAIYYGATLTLIALWAVIILQRKIILTKPITFLILLCSGLILRAGYPSPILRNMGIDAKEQAVIFLVDNYEPDTYVATGSPGVVMAAKMRSAILTSTDVPTERSPAEFLDWMKRQGIELIYVDHDLYNFSPSIWNLIEPQIGLGLERVFSLERGNYQILEFVEDT